MPILELSPVDKLTCKKQNLKLEELEQAMLTHQDRLKKVHILFIKIWRDIHLYPGLYIAHSGGKDSVVVYYLVKNFMHQGYTLPVVHTPKDVVVRSTRDFLYNTVSPLVIIKAKDMEKGQLGISLKTQFDGTRKAEHDRTDGRSTNVIVNGVDTSRENMPEIIMNGLFGLSMIYPILEWSDNEVWSFIFFNKIQYSPEYWEV